MLKYLEKLYFLNFCILYTHFKFILAKTLSRRIYARFTKKYPQTLVKPIFIKLGCQTRITIRNYQTSVSISIHLFIHTLYLCDNLLTLSLKLWERQDTVLGTSLKPRETKCGLFLLALCLPGSLSGTMCSEIISGVMPRRFLYVLKPEWDYMPRVRLQMSRSLSLLSEAELIWILQQKSSWKAVQMEVENLEVNPLQC